MFKLDYGGYSVCFGCASCCSHSFQTVDFIVENYELNRAPNLMTRRARGCPFIANVDGEDFVIDGFAKYKGYGDECKTIYFAGVALFQDEENKENGNLVFQFCFEYSYDTDEYKCYSDHFSDEIVENDFAYFIVENYERSCRNVKEVLKRRE